MPVWIIEPRDPLIARDGRPFGPTPGARAVSLGFPLPSTTVGVVRTRAGLGPDGKFDPTQVDRVKRIAVRGPLLVQLSEEGAVERWLLPAPSDALLLDAAPAGTDRLYRCRLAPLALPVGAAANLPEGMALVGPARPDPRKPARAPRFWFWERYIEWLSNPVDGEIARADLGCDGPVAESRMHVSLDPETQTAREGALFQTRGLEFTMQGWRRLALAVYSEEKLRPGLAPMGGERRLISWRASQAQLPALPPQVRQTMIDQGACRVILATPACFAAGWKPTWLLAPREGVVPALIGAAVPRYQVVSGWDLATTPQRPKPTRRLAPAGSVFFLKLNGEPSAIGRWVDCVWMQCVSDDEQDRNDGFGLAILGVWSGQLQKVEWGR